MLQVPFDHELITVRPGPRTALPFIVAIHTTFDGAGAGGCRLARYASPLDGIVDALRLSQGMSRKSAVSGTRTGGAKCVIAVPEGTTPWPFTGQRREEVLRDLADIVNAFGGGFFTGPDVGTSSADMEWTSQFTQWVGGFTAGGTSEGTAVGVLACLRAGAAQVFGSEDLTGRTVTVVGLGGVGEWLARLLAEAGASLAVTDVDDGKRAIAAELGAEWIEPAGAQRRDCDIVAPCALGGTLTAAEVGELRCRLVVGAANNQLADDAVAELLRERGITWVPDFVANAGGLLYAVSVGRDAQPRDTALARVRALGDTAEEILARAADEGRSTLDAAIAVADQRLLG